MLNLSLLMLSPHDHQDENMMKNIFNFFHKVTKRATGVVFSCSAPWPVRYNTVPGECPSGAGGADTPPVGSKFATLLVWSWAKMRCVASERLRV